MAYNEFDEMDEHAEEGGVQDANSVPEFTTESSSKSIMEEINKILMTPRFDGDACVILNMPDNTIKKARDKLNYALWKVYGRHKTPGFGMFEILCAIESMFDAKKLNTMLDNDVKLQVAQEKGISISVEELDYIAKHPYSPEEKEKKIIMCPVCHGTGIDSKTGDECQACLGEGKVMVVDDDTDTEEPEELSDEEFSKAMEEMGK